MEGDMVRRRRFAPIIIVVLLLLIVAFVVAAFIIIRQPFPETEGVIQLSGLEAPVEIYRDSFGIPHIYASSAHDLFMAQGFVHAQDRFWQMEFWRRIGTGRLSELLGRSTLDDDRYIRTLGWHRVAAQEVEHLGDEERMILESYSEGVNAYLELNQGHLGLEFTILGLTGVKFEPEPWTALNTLTWGKAMALQLGGNMDSELLRAHVATRLGVDAVNVLAPPYPDDYPVIVPEPITEATIDSFPTSALLFNSIDSGFGVGSNNWVISVGRTDTGMPLLANDPHLGIQMPSIWYEIGLHCEPVGLECPFNVVGVSFAGTPGVIIGHNDHIAWGVTNLDPDVQDLFVERINPENPNQYEYQGEWYDMEIVREEIFIAGEDDPVVVNVRKTRHGPIINDVAGGTEDDWFYGWQPLALSWTALQPGTVWQSIFMLNQAQNWEEFREALRYFDVPSQNFVYADIEGNIGYQAPGRIPIRGSGDGSMPVPGWTGEFEWVDFIPFDDLPRSFNPAQGYLATANHAVVDSGYPYFLSMDWAPGYRARRIIEMIEADQTISIDDIKIMQGNNSSLYAQLVLPYLLELDPSEDRQAQAMELLRQWDGQSVRDSAAAAFFEALRIQMVDEVFGDELGEKLLPRARDSLIVTLLNILPNPNSSWFDDVNTPEVETRETILLRALEKTVEELTKRLGRNIPGWQWGDLHTATFENQSLGRTGIGPIEALFNRGPVAVDGSFDTVNNTGHSLRNPFGVTILPSFRMIVDLSDLNSSLSIHTTGQSGHPFHPHYDDMIDLWRDIEYHPMLWARQDVVAAAEAHLTLTPDGNQ
ncbi:MAG: penicillin acylase family protein [Anaerolineales bacterium]|nr:penicillin acylase family protein [Anaerolineales bacterium]